MMIQRFFQRCEQKSTAVKHGLLFHRTPILPQHYLVKASRGITVSQRERCSQETPDLVSPELRLQNRPQYYSRILKENTLDLQSQETPWLRPLQFRPTNSPELSPVTSGAYWNSRWIAFVVSITSWCVWLKSGRCLVRRSLTRPSNSGVLLRSRTRMILLTSAAAWTCLTDCLPLYSALLGTLYF